MKAGGQKNQSGFTLLETLVALTVVGIVMSMSVTTLMNNLHSNLRAQVRYEAIQAAQAVLDDLRFTAVDELVGSPESDVTVSERTYHVQVSYCRIASLCTSDDSRHITVEVFYKSELVYETETVFSKFE